MSEEILKVESEKDERVKALATLGKPGEVPRQTKVRLFAAGNEGQSPIRTMIADSSWLSAYRPVDRFQILDSRL
jgi:hypothetical protein